MSLLQEALQRRQERAPKLEKVTELHRFASELLFRRGKKFVQDNKYRAYCTEIPVNDSEKVEIEVFSLTSTEKVRREKLEGAVVISIKDLSRRISLNGEETKIYDDSVEPELVKTLDEITQEDLNQWGEVIRVAIGSGT